MASQVRRDIIRMTSGAKSGHPGGAMSATDIMVSLFFEVMNLEPANFTKEGKEEDVFYLSNGHISPVLYSVLSRRGYFPISELSTFRVLGSRLQGHPTPTYDLPGVRIATGSLGQGISVAVGHATAKKIDGDKATVFVMTGDGELEEGQVWEAAQFAVARGIDNIVAIVDWNNQQIDGCCEDIFALGDIEAKFKAFGWSTIVVDGHNIEEVVKTLRKAKTELCGKGKPVVILAKTIMGKGVDFMEGTNQYHGKVTNVEQTISALSQIEETIGDY